MGERQGARPLLLDYSSSPLQPRPRRAAQFLSRSPGWSEKPPDRMIWSLVAPALCLLPSVLSLWFPIDPSGSAIYHQLGPASLSSITSSLSSMVI